MIRTRVWATNSSIDDRRIGSGSTTTVAPASQIACDGGDERPGGGTEEGHVAAGADAEGLEVGGLAEGLVVELAVRDAVVVAADDEGEVVTSVGPGLDPLGHGQHVGSDRATPPVVTGGQGFQRCGG